MPSGISNASSAVGNVSILNGYSQLKGKTIIYLNASANDGSAVMYSVANGKILYILAAGITGYGTTAGREAYIHLNNVNSKILKIVCPSATAEGIQTFVTYPHPLPAPGIIGGFEISLRAENGIVANGYIIGVLE